MLKVLLVDDEPWLMEGMKKIIKWEELGFVIAGCAYNGIEALAMFKEITPDLVFADIKMPGISGLEMIEILKKEYGFENIIVLSGHAEFSYAQKAMHLGVLDYLLKPVDETDLLNVLGKAKKSLAKDSNNEKLGLFDKLLIALYEGDQSCVSEVLRQVGAPEMYNSFITVLCEGSPGIQLETTIHSFMDYIVLSILGNRQILLVNYSKHQVNIQSLLINWLGKNGTRFGISREYSQLGQFNKSFYEARIMLDSYFNTDINESLYFYMQPETVIDKITFKQLKNSIVSRDLDKVKQLLEEIFIFFTAKSCSMEQFIVTYNRIISILKEAYVNESKELTDNFEYMDFEKMILCFKSDIEVKEHLIQLVEYLEDYTEISRGVVKSRNHTIKEVLRFIDENLYTNISMEELSKKLYLNSNYVGQLFKKEMGKSYTEYITEKRIDQAEKMLMSENLTIQEVCNRVGIGDYYYFNKLFKRIKGITPGKIKRSSP